MKFWNIIFLTAIIFLSWGCTKKSSDSPDSNDSAAIVNPNPNPDPTPPPSQEPGEKTSGPTAERACLTAREDDPVSYCGLECPNGLIMSLNKVQEGPHFVGDGIRFRLDLSGCQNGYQVMKPSSKITDAFNGAMEFTTSFESPGQNTIRVVVYPKNSEGLRTQLHFTKEFTLTVEELPPNFSLVSSGDIVGSAEPPTNFSLVSSGDIVGSAEPPNPVNQPTANLELLDVTTSKKGIFTDAGGNYYIADGYFILDGEKRIPVSMEGKRVSSAFPGGSWVVMMAKSMESGYQLLWRHPTAAYGHWELTSQGNHIKQGSLTIGEMIEWQKTPSRFLEVVEKLIPVIGPNGKQASTTQQAGWVLKEAKSVSRNGQRQFDLLWQSNQNNFGTWKVDEWGLLINQTDVPVSSEQAATFSKDATTARFRWSGQEVNHCDLRYCYPADAQESCIPNTIMLNILEADSFIVSGLPDSSVFQVRCDAGVKSEPVKVLLK